MCGFRNFYFGELWLTFISECFGIADHSGNRNRGGSCSVFWSLCLRITLLGWSINGLTKEGWLRDGRLFIIPLPMWDQLKNCFTDFCLPTNPGSSPYIAELPAPQLFWKDTWMTLSAASGEPGANNCIYKIVYQGTFFGKCHSDTRDHFLLGFICEIYTLGQRFRF